MNSQLFCTVCGGAFRPWTRECALRCDKLAYEVRRWRQYKRNLDLADAFDQTPAELAYATRRFNQYARNLYERARKAFVTTYYREYPEKHTPSKLWIVPGGITE